MRVHHRSEGKSVCQGVKKQPNCNSDHLLNQAAANKYLPLARHPCSAALPLADDLIPTPYLNPITEATFYLVTDTGLSAWSPGGMDNETIKGTQLLTEQQSCHQIGS